ncbi:hypothetical protein BHE90_015015 [Fusarium euwallaceae]|uniref:DNA2/NAM7 helicase helicase domain-containing protein n=1 Tax=Fusarium euwallaceae TaxID=1147111 RepID=A0A430L4C2_9HYPO|nr:hypothetical protein BHE90_015015 [Fusarium euwallaceae]
MSTSTNLRVDQWDLDPLDHPILFTLRQAFNDEDEYALLRLFVRGRDGPYCDFYQAKTRIGDQLKQFYVCVLQHANVICTTPYASSSKPWKRYKAKADAVILDEAGAMWKADALQVIGDTLRPTAMAGDGNQPAVMTLMDKKEGSMLN